MISLLLQLSLSVEQLENKFGKFAAHASDETSNLLAVQHLRKASDESSKIDHNSCYSLVRLIDLHDVKRATINIRTGTT